MRSGRLQLILVAALAVAGSTAATAGLTTTKARPASGPSGSIVVVSSHGIYRRSANGVVRQLITGRNAAFPVWSPDGKQIAFERESGLNEGCPLMVMNSDGSHVHRVGRVETDCSGAGWGPGGRRIAFGGWPGLGPCTPPSGSRCPAQRASLWVVNADGSGLRRLLHGQGTNVSGTHPAWSPDGRTIVFGWTASPLRGLLSVSPDGSGLHALARPQSKHVEWFSQPAWSRDGRRLAFVVVDLSAATRRIVVATSSGRGQRTLARLPVNPGPEGAPSWSPSGMQLAFSGVCGRQSCVWSIPSRGGTRHLLLRGQFFDANWGPAGT